jgi:putative NADH-flavin reductase
MKIAMFGATGTCGGPIMEAALDAGHEVHVLARAPEKIQRTDRRLTVTAGDALDAVVVEKVVAGADAVISALGGFRGPASLSDGTRSVMNAMRAHGLRRIVVVQGFHLRFPGDPVNAGQRLIGVIMNTVGRDIVEHSHIMAADLQADSLDWTLVRIPRVTKAGPTGNTRLGTLAIGPWNHVTTGDVAVTVVDLAASHTRLREAPMLVSGRMAREV